MAATSYATDGKCHNAEPGTFGHECGKPATWIGTDAKGFASGYCDACKQAGSEAAVCVTWAPIPFDNLPALPLVATEESMSDWWKEMGVDPSTFAG